MVTGSILIAMSMKTYCCFCVGLNALMSFQLSFTGMDWDEKGVAASNGFAVDATD